MRFRALDGFRGLCALLVCLYHFPVVSHLASPTFFLPNAQMLLDFFFVMSGFVIAGAYGDTLRGWGDLGTFAIRRFARLWPLHAAVLAAFVAIEVAKLVLAPHSGLNPPFTGRTAPEGIITSLLMIHSLDLHPMLVWNAPSWTVSVEFYTYLIYGALVVGLPGRSLVSALVMVGIGAFGVVVIAGQMGANYDFGIFRCFYGFFCGVIVMRLWRDAPALTIAPGLATLAEILVTVGVFAFMALWGSPPLGYTGPLLFSLFVAVYASERGLVTRLLSWRPLVRLGEISYSVYLVHFLVVVCIGLSLKSLQRFAHLDLSAIGITELDDVSPVRAQSKWIMDAISAAYVVLVVLIATQTNRFIEEPGRKAFSRLSFRRNRRLVSTTHPALGAKVKTGGVI